MGVRVDFLGIFRVEPLRVLAGALVARLVRKGTAFVRLFAFFAVLRSFAGALVFACLRVFAVFALFVVLRAARRFPVLRIFSVLPGTPVFRRLGVRFGILRAVFAVFAFGADKVERFFERVAGVRRRID